MPQLTTYLHRRASAPLIVGLRGDDAVEHLYQFAEPGHSAPSAPQFAFDAVPGVDALVGSERHYQKTVVIGLGQFEELRRKLCRVGVRDV